MMRQNTANQAEDTSQEQASGGRSWTETEDLCRKTLEFCAEKGLSPVPPIYELVFKYFEGKREDIVAGLGEALERGPVQSFQLLELHDKYLGNDDLAIAFGQSARISAMSSARSNRSPARARRTPYAHVAS